jgi:hypothetical protein
LKYVVIDRGDDLSKQLTERFHTLAAARGLTPDEEQPDIVISIGGRTAPVRNLMHFLQYIMAVSRGKAQCNAFLQHMRRVSSFGAESTAFLHYNARCGHESDNREAFLKCTEAKAPKKRGFANRLSPGGGPGLAPADAGTQPHLGRESTLPPDNMREIVIVNLGRGNDYFLFLS